MAERLVYVGSVCTITLTIPSQKDAVTIMLLPSKHLPPVAYDPLRVRAAVKIRYHRDR